MPWAGRSQGRDRGVSSTPIGDPDAIRALASACRGAGDALANVGDAVGVTAQGSQAWWQAPRAERFRASMDQQRQGACTIADDLYSLSAQLTGVAAAVESQLSILARIEARVLALFKDYMPAANVVAPWAGTPWSPGRLPTSGDPTWLTVARDLGVQ